MFSRRAIWKNSVTIVAIVLVVALTSSLAWADVIAPEQSPSLFKDLLGVSGTVRTAYFSKDMSYDGQSGFGVGSIWLTAKPEEVLGVKTYFDARVQGQDLTRSSDLSWEIREGYAETSVRSLDIKVGRQIIVWGRADKINPTDVWSTRNYTLLTTDDEDQRLGVSTLQTAWNQGSFRIIGIWQPEWRTPLIPIPPLPIGVTVQNLTPTNQASQFGLKIDHSGDVDYSLSYAHVIDRTPDLTVISQGSQGVRAGLQFNSIDVFGADAAIVLGDYGIRTEVAYTSTKNPDSTDTFVQRSNLFGVVGVERTFDGELNFNVQYLYKHNFNWQDPSQISDPNVKLLAQQENLASNQLGSDMHGASIRISYKAFHETLEGEIAAVSWLTRGDLALRPKVSYAFSDRIKAIVGAQLYSGPSDSFFGRLNPVSTVFTELRVSF